MNLAWMKIDGLMGEFVEEKIKKGKRPSLIPPSQRMRNFGARAILRRVHVAICGCHDGTKSVQVSFGEIPIPWIGPRSCICPCAACNLVW